MRIFTKADELVETYRENLWVALEQALLDCEGEPIMTLEENLVVIHTIVDDWERLWIVSYDTLIASTTTCPGFVIGYKAEEGHWLVLWETWNVDFFDRVHVANMWDL